MKIDRERLNRFMWYEDENNNVVTVLSPTSFSVRPALMRYKL